MRLINQIKSFQEGGKLKKPDNINEAQWKKAVELYNSAIKAGDKFPELTLAQAVLETGWFKSPSGEYNYFGQKATKNQPGSYKSTKEVYGGKETSINDKFRDYSSIDEAMSDRQRLWGNKYEKASTVEEALYSIWKFNPSKGQGEGYATDPKYDTKIKSVLNKFGINFNQEARQATPIEYNNETSVTPPTLQELLTISPADIWEMYKDEPSKASELLAFRNEYEESLKKEAQQQKETEVDLQKQALLEAQQQKETLYNLLQQPIQQEEKYNTDIAQAPPSQPFRFQTEWFSPQMAQEGGTIGYEDWKKQYNLQESKDYNLQRAYELGYIPDEQGHLPTVDNQTLQFLKYPNHPSINLEEEWYNSPEASEFRNKHTLDKSTTPWRYIPKQQQGGTVNINSSDESTDDLPAVELIGRQKAPEWLQYRNEFEEKNPRGSYIHENRSMWVNKQDLSDRYEKETNQYIYDQLIKNNPKRSGESRGEFVQRIAGDNMSVQDIIEQNKNRHSSTSENVYTNYARGLLGFYDNLGLYGNPMAKAAKTYLETNTYAPHEREQITNSPVENIGNMAEILSVPYNATVGTLYTRDHGQDNYNMASGLSGQVPENRNTWLEVGADPLNAVGVGAVSKASKAGKAIQQFSKYATKSTPLRNTYKLNPPKPKSNFKSEIDWGKWNKEIPENKALMQEYNAIEQQTKADGTWTKNPDGSKFKGTPEQFVQQNSQNFKRAFGDTPNIAYRGQTRPTETIGGGNRGYAEGISYLGDKDQALTYAETWKHPKHSGKIYQPGVSDPNTPALYELMYPNSTNKKVITHSEPRNWQKLTDDDVASQMNQFELELRGKSYKGEQFINTDDVGNYVDRNNIDYAYIPNITDYAREPSRKFFNLLPGKNIGNTLIMNSKPGNYLKSRWYNNGMFDMTNPNIYKSLVPAVGGTALLNSQYQQNQDTDTYQQGGTISPLQKIKQKFQKGGIISPLQKIKQKFQKGGEVEESLGYEYSEQEQPPIDIYNEDSPVQLEGVVSDRFTRINDRGYIRNKRAIENYQAENGLTPDGIIGTETASKILGTTSEAPTELSAVQKERKKYESKIRNAPKPAIFDSKPEWHSVGNSEGGHCLGGVCNFYEQTTGESITENIKPGTEYTDFQGKKRVYGEDVFSDKVLENRVRTSNNDFENNASILGFKQINYGNENREAIEGSVKFDTERFKKEDPEYHNLLTSSGVTPETMATYGGLEKYIKKTPRELKYKADKNNMYVPRVGDIVMFRNYDSKGRHAEIIKNIDYSDKDNPVYTLYHNRGAKNSPTVPVEFSLREMQEMMSGEKGRGQSRNFDYISIFTKDDFESGSESEIKNKHKKEYDNITKAKEIILGEGAKPTEYNYNQVEVDLGDEPLTGFDIEVDTKDLPKNYNRYAKAIKSIQPSKYSDIQKEDLENLYAIALSIPSAESGFGKSGKYKLQSTGQRTMPGIIEGITGRSTSAGLARVNVSSLTEEEKKKYFLENESKYVKKWITGKNRSKLKDSDFTEMLVEIPELNAEITLDKLVNQYRRFKNNPELYEGKESKFWNYLTLSHRSPNAYRAAENQEEGIFSFSPEEGGYESKSQAYANKILENARKIKINIK